MKKIFKRLKTKKKGRKKKKKERKANFKKWKLMSSFMSIGRREQASYRNGQSRQGTGKIMSSNTEGIKCLKETASCLCCLEGK